MPGTDDLVTIDAYGGQPVLHPAEQVRQYCEYLEGFNRYIENSDVAVYGAAYLHNWLGQRTTGIDRIAPNNMSQIFIGSEKSKWILIGETDRLKE